MLLPENTALFPVRDHPLWGSEHFPPAYLASPATPGFAEAQVKLLRPQHLLCCCDQEQQVLGLFYHSWSLLVDYRKASSLVFEQLHPGKGAGSVYLCIEFAESSRTPFLMLSAGHQETNLSLLGSVAQTLARLTGLPLHQVDLGHDV